MKQRILFCSNPWPFFVLPLLLFVVLLFFKWHDIEDDVANNTRTDLKSIGADWANVETTNRGRNVLITGTPPSEEAIAVAKQKAEQSYGVHRVDISSDVKPIEIPPIDPELNTIITGESVVLRGSLADQAAIDATVSQAEAAFGAENVINRLNIADNTSPLPNLDGFFLNLAGKSYSLETLTASLKGSSLTLKGTVNSDESRGILDTQMGNVLGLKVTNVLDVAAPPPPVVVEVEPEPTIEIDVCQDLINDLLSNSKLNFATGKAVIQEDSYQLLDAISETALRCPEASFEVSGHTDSTGNLESNIRLSQQRAQTVVDHLVNLGVDASKFTAAGYGPNKPIADNNTSNGRALNRRIEFKLKN